MIKKIALPLIFIAFVMVVIYSTLSLGKVSCTVCVEFEGQQACRTASGPTRDDAIRTATDNACAQVASGMSESRTCTSKPPVSVECE